MPKVIDKILRMGEGKVLKQLEAIAKQVNAIEDDAKIDIMHACGGNAGCTTCRVEFIAGEPPRMTEAEKKLLTMRNLINTPSLRLSCQILCDHDMEVRCKSRVSTSGAKNAGDRPADAITPPPVWTTR